MTRPPTARRWALGLALALLGAVPVAAQRPAAPPPAGTSSPPLRVWGWRHQGPPLTLTITREADCLRLATAQQIVLQRPVALTRDGLVYFTLTPDPDLAGWAVVRLGGWALATAPGTWLHQLAGARRPHEAGVGRLNACPTVEAPSVPVSVEALAVIHGSALVRDTLEPLLGPLPKALGVQPYTTTGTFAEAHGAFLYAPEAPHLDSIVLASPARDWEDVRYTLLHEWGHRWHQRQRPVALSWTPGRLAPWTDRTEQMADLFAYGDQLSRAPAPDPRLRRRLGAPL